MNKALFLDRDGTIIYDKNYLSDPDQVELIPGASEALKRARELGYMLFLFTNQSGIGRGRMSMDDVRLVNERMERLLGLPIPVFDEICIAPETPDDKPVYRKPSPRFILEMLAKHDLAAEACFMIGDKPSDILAGIQAGIKAVALTVGGEDPHTWPEVVEGKATACLDLREFVAGLESEASI